MFGYEAISKLGRTPKGEAGGSIPFWRAKKQRIPADFAGILCFLLFMQQGPAAPGPLPLPSPQDRRRVSAQPVRLLIVQQKRGGAESPGKGIHPVYHLDTVGEGDGNGEEGHPHHAPEHHHDDHGDHGPSRSPQNRGNGVGKRQQAVKQRRRPGLFHPKADHLRGGVKGRDHLRGKYKHHDPDQLRQDDGHQNPKAGPLLRPLKLPCAQILPHKGGQRHRKAVDGQEAKALHLGIGAVARHGGLAEGVDIGLHDHVGKGNDGILHAGGKADPDHLDQDPFVKADLPQPQTVVFLRPQQLDQAQQSADHLGNDRGQGGAAYPCMERRDKRQVQHQIDHRGDDQVVQRMAAVPHRLQNPHEDVIHHKTQGAGKIDLEIGHSFLNNTVGGVHPKYDLGREQYARQRHQNPRHQAERHRGMDGPAEIPRIIGAEILGYDHAGAGGNAAEEANQHKNQAAGRTDSRQRTAPQEISHDQRIHRIVHLLEQIPQQERQRKKRNPLPDHTASNSQWYTISPFLHLVKTNTASSAAPSFLNGKGP